MTPDLWAHQLACIERAKDRNHYALMLDMGTGKSRTLIEILKYKMNREKKILKTLIVSPIITLSNWRNEWLKYSKIDPKHVIILEGSAQKREKTFCDNAYRKGEAQGKVFILGYECLTMTELFMELKGWEPDVIVFDESQRLKSPETKRSKLAYKLANPVKAKKPATFILTGTPVLNSAMDLFQQFYVMDGGKSFGDNVYGFRAKYFTDKNAGFKGRANYFPDFVIKKGAVSEINKILMENGTRVEKSECLDLPPLVKTQIKVGMTPEQSKAYQELKTDFITFINDKACSATLAITKALRLMQITSGFISLDGQGEESDPVKIYFPKTPKLKALEEILSDLTPKNKVLVWCVWKSDYTAIRELCHALKIKCVEVHGEISNEKKREAVDQFNQDESVRVFIGHPGAAGVGINLVTASYSLFYSRTFSLEQSLQAEARNYRGGSKEAGHEKITRIDLVVENTIDELVVERLLGKEQLAGNLLGDISSQLIKQSQK